MLGLVEVFITPLHSAVTLVTPLHSAVTSVTLFHRAVTGVGVRARIPTSDLSELGFKVMRMRCLRGDLCAGSLGTLFKYRRSILNGATFRTRAEPLQLRSSSECQGYMLNASLMLRTSG